MDEIRIFWRIVGRGLLEKYLFKGYLFRILIIVYWVVIFYLYRGDDKK